MLAGVALAWLWAAGRRRAALAHALAEPTPAPAAHACERPRPHVTCVLPVKGCSAAKLRNWRSQLRSDYGGRLDFVFVTECADDPAVRSARTRSACDTLAERAAPPQHAAAAALCGEAQPALRTAATAVAGLASRTSQKIHNQLAGVAAASPATAFFLFLDDDVWLHPCTVERLVGALEADAAAFMATGYPFDVPHARATFWSLCVMVRALACALQAWREPQRCRILSHAPRLRSHVRKAYHLPLLVAFSQGRVSRNVWGGCMLLRAAHCAPGGCVARAWGEGAYSDDLILAALAGARRQRILCPGAAVFPTALEPRCSAAQAWNYLRRQLFVLDTYTSPHNRRARATSSRSPSLLPRSLQPAPRRRVNHMLLACTVYGAFALLAPVAPALLHLLVRPAFAFLSCFA